MMVEIAHALERAAAALDSRDAAAASAALAEAERACASAESRGVRPDRAELEVLRELHRRGQAAAERALEDLAQALGSAGSARRAVSAYRK